MKIDKRIDELFRKGLPSVDLPAAPQQDWAAMARSARAGAAAAGRAGAMSARWTKILGGALAVMAAFYLAFDQGATGEGNRLRLATANPLTILPGRAEKNAPVADDRSTEMRADVVNRQDPSTTRSMRNALPAGTEKMDAEQPETSTTPFGSGSTSTRMKERLPTHAKTTKAIGRTSANDNGGMGTDVGPIPHHGSEVHAVNGSNDRVAAPSISGFPYATEERSPGIAALAVLPTLPSPLPYTPNEPSSAEEKVEHTFPHWAVAPWLSLGHSVFTDPDHGNGSEPEGLISGNDLPGSAGLRVQYAFDRHLAFFTGIQASRKGSLRGTVTSSSTLRTEYQLSGNYVEIPLALKFILPLENKELYARGGISLLFNMASGSDKVTMYDQGQKQTSTLVLASGSMGTAVDLGIGAQFRLSRHVGLFIEPSYQYSLSPVVKHPSFDRLPFNPRIHTFSLITGLSFQFHDR